MNLTSLFISNVANVGRGKNDSYFVKFRAHEGHQSNAMASDAPLIGLMLLSKFTIWPFYFGALSRTSYLHCNTRMCLGESSFPLKIATFKACKFGNIPKPIIKRIIQAYVAFITSNCIATVVENQGIKIPSMNKYPDIFTNIKSFLK